MPDPFVSTFLDWLDSELARRGALPSWDVYGAIARALDVPPELVFCKAGLLPEREDEPAGFEHWRYILERLSDEDRDELMEIARLKLDRKAQRRHPDRLDKALKEPGSQ